MNDPARMSDTEPGHATTVCLGPNNDRIPPSSELRISSFIRVFGFRHLIAFTIFLACCDKSNSPPTTPSTTPTIASLVPAATDLIVGMGARDRLVAVSTYDSHRDDVGQLPKAGNYDTIDWELMRSLHPSLLVTQISADRQSPGFKANASELNIRPVNVTIENLNDIFMALDQLGIALKEAPLAQSAHQKMRTRLDEIQHRVANEKRVRTLLVISPTADAVIGCGTYLDDLLKIAGGINVIPPEMGHWPSIDREKLQSLKPDAILQLLPKPDTSQQQCDRAAALWKQLPQIPAVARNRVYPIYDRYVLVPGWHVTELAETFSQCLHPAK